MHVDFIGVRHQHVLKQVFDAPASRQSEQKPREKIDAHLTAQHIPDLRVTRTEHLQRAELGQPFTEVDHRDIVDEDAAGHDRHQREHIDHGLHALHHIEVGLQCLLCIGDPGHMRGLRQCVLDGLHAARADAGDDGIHRRHARKHPLYAFDIRVGGTADVFVDYLRNRHPDVLFGHCRAAELDGVAATYSQFVGSAPVEDQSARRRHIALSVHVGDMPEPGILFDAVQQGVFRPVVRA